MTTLINITHASKTFALPDGGQFHAVRDVSLRDINHRLGVTIVIVSHELSVIGEICNRVAVIEDGAIAEQFALDDAAGLAPPRKTALGRELALHGAATRSAAARVHASHKENAHV